MFCLEKVGCVFSYCCIQEKYFWKLICFICSSFLALQLFLDYFLIAPTVSSFERLQLSPDFTPDILVCDGEGFVEKSLEKHGYKSTFSNLNYITGPFNYMTGLEENGTFFGWNGLQNIDSLRKQFKHFIKTKYIIIIFYYLSKNVQDSYVDYLVN